MLYIPRLTARKCQYGNKLVVPSYMLGVVFEIYFRTWACGSYGRIRVSESDVLVTFSQQGNERRGRFEDLTENAMPVVVMKFSLRVFDAGFGLIVGSGRGFELSV